MGDTLSSTTRHIYYASIICFMQSPQIKLVALVTLAIAPQQGHIILILLFFFFGVVGVVPDDEPPEIPTREVNSFLPSLKSSISLSIIQSTSSSVALVKLQPIRLSYSITRPCFSASILNFLLCYVPPRLQS